MGCQTTFLNKDVVKNSDVVFLAVKPHLIVQVVKEIAAFVVSGRHLFVSVATAMTTEVIEEVSKISSGSKTQSESDRLIVGLLS